jgi:hypothetical protein
MHRLRNDAAPSYAGKTPEQIEARRKRAKDHYRANKDAVRAKTRKVYDEQPEIWRLGGIRQRAREQGLPCNLTAEDVRAPEFCPVLGIRLERNRGKGHGPAPNSPSVDRIIPELGYVKGNVIVVSNLANCIKHNATPEQIRLVADFYARLQAERATIDLQHLHTVQKIEEEQS